MTEDSHAPPSGPVTLGDLIREGKLLRVFCDVHAGGCGHERDIYPASLQLGPGESVPDLVDRLRRIVFDHREPASPAGFQKGELPIRRSPSFCTL
jgi:hypothetical protein